MTEVSVGWGGVGGSVGWLELLFSLVVEEPGEDGTHFGVRLCEARRCAMRAV